MAINLHMEKGDERLEYDFIKKYLLIWVSLTSGLIG